MSSTATILVTGTALIAGVTLAGAAPASAATISCGTVVTASITLTGNVDCQGDTTDAGLVIEGSGITVDLGGHSILGPGTGAGTAGISDTSSSYHGDTIENGTISDFSTGVQLEGAAGSDLSGTVVRHITIPNKTLGAQNYGVYGQYVDGTTVSGLSTADVFYGVELEDCLDVTVTQSHLTGSYYAGQESDDEADIWSHDTISDAISYGLYIDGSTDTIEDNTLNAPSAYGIFLYQSDSHVTGNTLDAYAGVYDEYDTDSVISGNTGSGDAWGIYSSDPIGVTFRGNQFNQGVYGIETDDPKSETVKGNTTDGNSEAGVYVYTDGETSGFAASLIQNTANDNRYGLYSQFHVKGYGNSATGNTRINCHDVVCPKT